MSGLAALLGALGGVFFLFGVLSFLLLLVGAPTDLYWIYANFVIGAVLLVAAVASNLEAIRERLTSGEGRRIGRYGTSAILQTVFVLFIIGALGVLSTRYHWRYDASEEKVHSLSDQTKKVLAGIDQDVDVVAFFPKLNQPVARDLLDKYTYEDKRFHVEYADPNARPDLVERYKIKPEKLGDGLLHVTLGGQSVDVEKPDEPKLTNALIKLSRRTHKKVYFVIGHNERPITGKDSEGKEGYARAADALRDENYQVDTLLLATKGDVPDDADVVIIAGPTRPLLPQEHAALDRYLARGGSLLVMIDPRAQTDLVPQLAQWGVDVGNDAIVDRVQGLFGQAMSPLAGAYADHPITRDMRDATLFPMARSVQPEPNTPGASFTEIVKTSDHSWAERDLDKLFDKGIAELGPDDLKGPVPVAVAGKPRVGAATPTAADGAGDTAQKKPEHEPRLVVFGDSDFASNQAIEAYQDRDLFVNSVNWLLGDVQAISIRPNRARASRLSLSTEQLSQIRYVSLFVLPEAIAVVGALAWWSRRRAPGR
jgi:ABC-type uncharacterized transport system involved in gliding motility auxiliary subunit